VNASPSQPPLAALPWPSGLAYGLLGLPLAFGALPLYVVLPHHYASVLGLPLATAGALLMVVRLLDALIEPVLGRVSDRLYRISSGAVLWLAALSGVVQWVGQVGLFFPPVAGVQALSVWMVLGLLLVSLAHSQLAIAHQAWGVRLGGDALMRSRIVAWREGAGLVGVVLASMLSVADSPGRMLQGLALAFVLGCCALWKAPRPPLSPTAPAPVLSWRARLHGLTVPVRVAAFRRLWAVFLCNGVASAVPAALMLFFAQDRLQASPSAIALCLVLYFVSGVLSMPLWLRAVRRWGLERSWRASMGLAVACFVWTAGLGAGQALAFATICALSGAALGADLALPGALLARTVALQGAQGSHEGAYLGWWNLATKLSLAIAAGAALPLLQGLGYQPGTRDPHALQWLTVAYAMLPCALKGLAAWLLTRLLLREVLDAGAAVTADAEAGGRP